jgi:hypothetical protein
MAVAVAQQTDHFLNAFKKEVDSYVKKLQQQGDKKDPKRVDQVTNLAEKMFDNISRRWSAYADACGLSKDGAEEPSTKQEGGRALVPMKGPFADGPARTRLQELEAEMRRCVAEEDRLRSELLERTKADSDEALRQCNAHFTQAQQAAVVSDQVLEASEAATKGEQLQRQLQQLEALLAASQSISTTLDRDRENNLRIEEQRRRPPLPVEAELLTPADHGAPNSAPTDMDLEDDEEFLRMAEEVAQSQKVCERMQRQFNDFA